MRHKDERYPIERVYPKEFKAVLETFCLTKHEFYFDNHSIGNKKRKHVGVAKTILADLLFEKKLPMSQIQLFLFVKGQSYTYHYINQAKLYNEHSEKYRRLKRHVINLITNGR